MQTPPKLPNLPPIIAEVRPAPLQPTTKAERLLTLDVLRGFALFGILSVNMAHFSWPEWVASQDFSDSRVDQIADRAISFLAEGKFYPLFAFLFGLGAAIQMERAEASDRKFASRFSRRLLVLLGFGLAHALLLWEGDILVWYAVGGFLLIPFQRRQPRTILIWGVSCVLIPALLVILLWALMASLSLVPEIATKLQKVLGEYFNVATGEPEKTIQAYAGGTYGEILRLRLPLVLQNWLAGLFYLPGFLGIFLLGVYAGKRRILHDVEAHLRFLRSVLVGGLVIGVPANLLYVISVSISDFTDIRFFWLLGYAVLEMGGPAQSLAYAAALALLLRREFWQRGLRAIAAAGRMPLSNYLLQSLICTTLFYGYGFGLFGSVSRAVSFIFVALLFATQVGLSIAWLSRFQFGPAEWLWRMLSYGQRPTMKPLENQ